MNRIKAAILGYGRSGDSLHAAALEANKDLYEVAAACDIEPARLEVARKRFNCRTYDDYLKMIAAERPDVVIIVTRSSQHCQMVCDCLGAGVNVLVTKPWCVNASEAERMIAAQKQSGKMLLPWLPARWGPDLLRVREIVASGELGEVFLVRRIQTTFSLRVDWQMEKKFGGGYLLNWGPHLVDTGILATGRKPVSVFARMRKVINPGDAEDIFFAATNVEGGGLVVSEFTHSAKRLPDWVVQGAKGTLTVEDGTQLTVLTAKGMPKPDPTNYGTKIETETRTETVGGIWSRDHVVYRDIAAGLRGEKPYAVTPQDALALTRIFDAIRRSSETGQVVPIG